MVNVDVHQVGAGKLQASDRVAYSAQPGQQLPTRGVGVAQGVMQAPSVRADRQRGGQEAGPALVWWEEPALAWEGGQYVVDEVV